MLYFVGGPPFSPNDNISAVPLSAVQEYLAAPQPALDALGWGAGITSGTPVARALGNYFPYGTAPSFYASFDPWWKAQASHLQLSYSVWTDSDVREGAYPEPTTLALPTSGKALNDIPLTMPPADGRPGPYELQAELWDTAASPPVLLGATCAPYGVGAPGDALNFSSLPTGEGYGGPADPRGVVLNSEFGLDGFRGAAISWGEFLPGCNPSAPTATACDAAAMTFADAPQSYFQAAYLAGQDKVSYWVQVSTGDPVSKALVANGWWEQDVQAVVAYYSGTSHCTLAGGQCAPVTAWEPWNEANNTYSSNGGLFVKKILGPFYDAVKAAAPQDVVIGGSSLGVALAWWQQVVAAGGLAYMDVAGVHPYTGNNDSWDEDGTVAQLGQLQHALGAKPVWLTEVGWWSDGPYNFLGQASTVATALIWQRALAIPVWSYFFDEGGWGNDGVSFSLVQAASTDDYVKPAALAAMEASQQLTGRAYLGSPKTGVPLTHEATFGPAPGGSDDLAAVWTDGLFVTAQMAVSSAGTGPVTVTVTDQWGNAGSYQLAPGQYYALPVSSEVTYLTFPEGDALTVAPTEPYGADLARTSGAVATASSSASGYRAEDSDERRAHRGLGARPQ